MLYIKLTVFAFALLDQCLVLDVLVASFAVEPSPGQRKAFARVHIDNSTILQSNYF